MGLRIQILLSIGSSWYFISFYICFGWKTPQKQVIHGKGGAAANSRHFGNYGRDRLKQPASILNGRRDQKGQKDLA